MIRYVNISLSEREREREFDSLFSIFSLLQGLYFLIVTCTLFYRKKQSEIKMTTNGETWQTLERQMRSKCLSAANKWVQRSSHDITKMDAEWMWRSGGCDWLRHTMVVFWLGGLAWQQLIALSSSWLMCCEVPVIRSYIIRQDRFSVSCDRYFTS